MKTKIAKGEKIMFKKLIPTHIQHIKSLDYKNLILVYKGFPINFLLELSDYFPFLNEKEDIITNNKINLKNLWESRSESLKNVLNNSGISILTYEEFGVFCQTLSDLSLVKSELIIFENNLFDYYPNQSTEKFIDIEQHIENNDTQFTENEIFSKFYSDSLVFKGINFIKSKEIDLGEFKNVKVKSFFGKDYSNIKLRCDEIEPDEAFDDDVLIFPSPDTNLDLAIKVFEDEPTNIKSLKIIVNNNLIFTNKKYEKSLTRLKVIYNIFEQNNIQIELLLKRKVIKKKARIDFREILSKYWKSNDFRDLIFYKNPEIDKEKETIGQDAIIEEIVRQSEQAHQEERNNFNDIFLTAPTGSGKSILFQIPAIYLAEKYKRVTIVVSPLKSLMVDQVESLQQRGVKCATFINSDISLLERENIIEDIKKGEISILYLSPELLLSYSLEHFIGEREVGLLVVDEAHLVTTWGRDFRVDYWYLGNYIRRLRKYSKYTFPVFAMTATAVFMGENDIVFQTVESLNMQTPKLFIGNVVRNNIAFDIKRFEYTGSHEIAKIEKTKEIIQNNIDNNVKTIVYFPWITQIKRVRNELDPGYKEKVGMYYGDLDRTVKQITLEQFQNGEILVILATKAFGMGVDIRDIKVIYHHAPSGNLLDYIQEVGRAAREEYIQGLAKTDFCGKDLKFTRILHGLSSIKQYQVIFTLKKIFDIYSYRKKQNFLISVEDFGFIFSDKVSDLETKVKSSLMLLEKDLIKKHSYNVIIARPKSLFSEVFACIPEIIENQFLDKYDSFCEQVSRVEDNYQQGFRRNPIITHDAGNIYLIKLADIWEKYFYKDSFPMVKKKFFDQTLFEEFEESVAPRYQLTINLNQTKGETIEKVHNYFTKIESAFNKIQGRFFTKRHMLSLLKEDIKDEILRRRIVELLVNLYTSPCGWGENGRILQYDTFLQTKQNDNGEYSYRVIRQSYMVIKHSIIRKINSMFENENILRYCKYITTNDKDSNYQIKISYILESLNLGSYSIIGGQTPQVFIRINDPYLLKKLVKNSEYKNEILQDIENRYKSAVETMNYFFTEDIDTKTRWEYVEDYFLGKI
jgi:ATP-dependent DNA helicase RecQ